MRFFSSEATGYFMIAEPAPVTDKVVLLDTVPITVDYGFAA